MAHREAILNGHMRNSSPHLNCYAIMKMGLDFFRNTLLKNLGVNYTFVEAAPTEIVSLTIEKMYLDYTFFTTEDLYAHFEFQTTDGKAPDLRRFHSYEATMSHRTGKKVVTYVIYSGGIEATDFELDCGAYTYKVIPIYLNHLDCQNVFSQVDQKVSRNEALSEEDFANLALTPVMAGGATRKDTIKTALQYVKNYQTITAQKTMAILYAFADKFLEAGDLDEIKEAISMTRIGQMILDEGIQKGLSQGISQGIKIGREQEAERMRQLIAQLVARKRFDDIQKIAVDADYLDQLLNEFKL